MTNQIAVVVEEKGEKDHIKVLRESEKYFDQIVAIESKDLKFYFDEHSDDTLMYSYFLQVCPHQQDLKDLRSDFFYKFDLLPATQAETKITVFVILSAKNEQIFKMTTTSKYLINKQGVMEILLYHLKN